MAKVLRRCESESWFFWIRVKSLEIVVCDLFNSIATLLNKINNPNNVQRELSSIWEFSVYISVNFGKTTISYSSSGWPYYWKTSVSCGIINSENIFKGSYALWKTSLIKHNKKWSKFYKILNVLWIFELANNIFNELPQKLRIESKFWRYLKYNKILKSSMKTLKIGWL